MAISNGQYIVADEPLALNTADDDGCFIFINSDVDVYLGGEKVTKEDGYLYRKSDPPLCLELAPDEILYAICKDKKAFVTTLRTKNR
jgi:hypothetical protein